MKYCKKCGERLDEDALFCMECGYKIDYEPVKSGDMPMAKKDPMRFFWFVWIVVILVVVIMGAMAEWTKYRCDGCGEICYGTSYYDIWDSDIYYCKDCAMEYYEGYVNYRNFKR